ncbi:MAG TPA: RHS repeat-associated core domain-containing protein [Blastocatellia bacterium]|nr:RHS repeat-associated core domain-containing protein [Blastocatellia bacterium]
MRLRRLLLSSRPSFKLSHITARGWRRRALCLVLIFGSLIIPDAGYAVRAATDVAVKVVKDSVEPIPIAVRYFKRLFRRAATPPRQETPADRLAAVSHIQITPQKFVGYQGQTVSFSALPLNANGDTIQGVRLDWLSDSDKVQIDEAGRAHFLQPGLAHIICHAGTTQATIPVLVRPGARPIQSDEDWRRDQHSLSAAGTVIGSSVTNSPDHLFSSWLDKLTPTAQAQIIIGGGGGGCPASGDFGYDELWNDPRNLVGNPRNRATESTRVGTVMPEGSNFCFAAPIYSLGGRGIGANVTLYYNSRVWSRHGNNLDFNAINGWPGPGFSLGFGRVVPYGVQGTGYSATCKYLLIDPDGTRHYLGSGYYSQTGSYTTNDGSHISFTGNASVGGTVGYADGMSVYMPVVNNRILPTQILDRNGNYITIAYKPECVQVGTEEYCDVFAPMALDYVTDTMGRKVQFNYDSNYRLTSITAPGFGGTSQNPVTQTLVQFDYQTVTTSGTFSGLTIECGPGSSITTLRHIYYPATGNGYMLSYSPYGVVTSVSGRRQMTSYALDGVESNNVSFNYPTSGPLTDVPAFTQRTESAVNALTSIYNYSRWEGSGYTVFIVQQPDGTYYTVSRYGPSTPSYGGLLYYIQPQRSDGFPMHTTTFSYANDPGGSPQVQYVFDYDETSQPALVGFDYDASGNILNKRDYGYQTNGQWLVRRRTHNVYTAISGAVGLLTETDVYDAQLDANDANDVLIAKTTYTYDNYAAMGGMDDHRDPNTGQLPPPPPGHYSWYDTTYMTRGNVTGRTVWYDISNNLSYTWLRKIDIFGNMTQEQLSCCNQETVSTTQNNFWALPESITKGPSGGPQLTTSTQYDFNTSRVTGTTNPAGLITTPSYDAAGRAVTAAISDSNNHTLPSPTVSYGDGSLTITDSMTYDDNGTQKTLTSTKTLDGWGRIIQTINPAQSQVNTIYDNMGRVASVSNPFTAGGSPAFWTTNVYDALSRVVEVDLPDDHPSGQRSRIQTAYSANTVTVTDQVSRKMLRVTDGLGRLVAVNEQDSAGNLTQATNYTYDYLGNLTQVNQGNQLRAFKYDAMGRLLYERIPEQSATINDGSGSYWTCKYTYNDFAVASRQDARGVVTTYSYDALHRLTYTSYDTSNAPGVAATDWVMISYNNDGTLNQVNQANNYTETYSYDFFKRVSSVTKFIAGSVYDLRKTYSFSYTYNGASQPLTLTYPSGTQVSYSYDNYGRLNARSGVSSISYNVAGQVTSDTLGNGVTEQFGYDAARLQLTSQKAGTTSPYTNRMNLTYTYSAAAGQMGVGSLAGNAGQLMGIVPDANNNPSTINGTTENAAYTYDNYGRLVTGNQTSNGTSAQRRFVYDRWSNRTGVWDATSGGNQIQSISLQQSGGAPTNQIASVTTTSTVNYTYDANGNVTNDGTHSYTYDGKNRLLSVDSGAAQYRYDAQNHRVCKIIGSSWTHYVWQGNQCLAEHDGTTAYGNFGDPPYGLRSAKVDYLYTGARQMASYRWSHVGTSHTYTPQYYLSDRLSVRLTLDTSGNVVGRQAHLPFGEDWAESGTQQKQHFTSYERDSESSNDYAVNRFESVNVGRFLSVDPLLASGKKELPQSWNRFDYTRNDPINMKDPNGLDGDPFLPGPGGTPQTTATGDADPCDPLGPSYFLDGFELDPTRIECGGRISIPRAVEPSGGDLFNCSILLRFRPIQFMDLGTLLGKKHAYILTVNKSGTTHHFSGGPDNNHLNAWGPDDYGPSVGDDYQTDPSQYNQLTVESSKGCDYWDEKFRQTVQYTRSANVAYHWYGPNSNSFAAKALRDAGLIEDFSDAQLIGLLHPPFNPDTLEYDLEYVIPGWHTFY